MNTFIDITNRIIEQKLVLTHKVHLSRVEYSVAYGVLAVKVVFYTTDSMEERRFKYNFCVGGGCGFPIDAQELLKKEFEHFVDDNFKAV